MTIRVLYLIDNLNDGGAETSLVEIVPELVRNGVELTVVSLLADNGALRDRLVSRGARLVTLQDDGWPRKLRRLHALVASGDFDIVHTTLLRADLIGRVVARLGRVPVVTTLPNVFYGPEHRRNSRYGAWTVVAVQVLDAITARLGTCFHAVSHEVGTTMRRRLGVPARKFAVVHRGRDRARLGHRSQLRRDSVRTELGIAATTPLVLLVGRLDKQKAIDVAVRAVDIVRGELPDVEFWIVGRDGNDSEVVRARVADSGPQTRLLGSRADVPDLMAAADLLLSTSRWEGLPGVVLEAMALELPIVGTAIGPTAEATAGTEVELVPLDDAAAAAAAILAALRDPARAGAAAHAALERFDAEFTIAAAGDNMASLYTALTAGGPVPERFRLG